MSNTKTEGTVLKATSFRAGKIIVQHMYILLLVPLVIIGYPLTAPGIPITLDFPTIDSPNYASDRLWAWWEKGSSPGLEGLSRFPIFGLWHGLTSMGFDVALLTKLNIVLGFFIASFSFYFSFCLLFKNKFTDKSRTQVALNAAAIVGALFYAYNPWSFERIVHWYLWIGYALLPLFFVSTIFTFRDYKNFKYILTSIFLWSFSSTTPHMAVFYGIIFIFSFIAFIVDRILVKKGNGFVNKQVLLRLSANFLVIIVLFSLVNLYWIYPYLLSSQVRSVSPNYLLVEENLEALSKQNDLLSTLRLIGNWQEQQVEVPFQNTTLYSLWLFSGIALPIFAFSAFLLSRKSIKYVIIFAIFVLAGILLAMGTQSPIDYFTLMLASPLLANYSWLFRDPDKWSFLIAFGYSYLIGIACFAVIQLFAKLKHSNSRNLITSAFLFLLVGSIFLYSYPVYMFNMDGKFKPIVLPPEFNKLNTYLSNVTTDKVFFIPYPLEETQWNKLNRVGDIYQMHSIKPSIESTGFTGMAGMGSTNYYNYLENSIIENRTRNIGNSINPLGTSYIIFHNDTWDKQENTFDSTKAQLLRQLYAIDDLTNIHNVGFYNLFRVDDNKDTQQFDISKHKIVSLGGLQTQHSLDKIPSFSSLNSSLLFADDIHTNDTNEFIKNSDYIILEKSPSFGDLLFSFVDEKYILQPFAATNRYEPIKAWSKSGATDPDFGNFHPHLNRLGIQNWEFDYGKGLVITQAMGAKLSFPAEIQESGEFDLFLRYLKNQKGGTIKVYLDNKLIHEIGSEDYNRSNNNFVWENIGSTLNLTKGEHTITLENVAGFNAVNILAMIPTNETSKLVNNAYSIANKAKNIYMFEAESDFYNNNVRRNNYSLTSMSHLFEHNSSDNFNRTMTGQFRIPVDADLISLQFISNANSSTNNSTKENPYYSISNLQIYPAKEKQTVFNLDFERENSSIPLAALRQEVLTNLDEYVLSTSLDKSSPPPNTALRANIKQNNATDWSILSTDYIPVNDKKYYNFSLDVSAKDVKQLHAKVNYYDSDKRRIMSDLISVGRDGVFSDTLSSSIVPPLGAKYVKYEILVIPNPAIASSYLLDNLKFEEIIPQKSLLDSNFTRFQNVGINAPSFPSEEDAEKENEYAYAPAAIVHDRLNNRTDSGFLRVELDKGEGVINYSNKSNDNTYPEINNGSISYPTYSPARYNLMQTKPIPVKENAVFNYTIGVEGKGLNYFASLASFRNNSDIVENSTKYGANASNGNILSLSPGSEIYANLDVLKASNYTIALRTSTCIDRCNYEPLAVSIARQNPNNTNNDIIKTTNVSLKDYDSASAKNNYANGNIIKSNPDAPQLKWLYLNNTYLEKGIYEIRIHSSSHVDLDSVIVYSTPNYNSNDGGGDARNHYESLEELFNPIGSTEPAYISDYKKLDPTKYEIKIENATRPYVISLAESYDPLWVAHASTEADNSMDNHDNKIFKRSVPLFSVVNGHYINRTGDYTLTIEYEPQKWLVQGGTISIVTVLAILAYIVFSNRKKLFPFIHAKDPNTEERY
jgi:hypothetical protein